MQPAASETRYSDERFGGRPVTPGTGTEEIIPFTGSLSSNLGAPILNPFDSHTILASEGQIFTEFLSLGANSGAAGVVAFEADLASAGLTGDTWSLTFG